VFLSKSGENIIILCSVYLTRATNTVYHWRTDLGCINSPIYEWISVGYPCLGRCHRGNRSTSVGPRQSAAVQKRHWQLTRKISLQMWHGSANTTFTLDFQMRNYTQTLHNREGVDLLYVYTLLVYILYKRILYIHSKWYLPPLNFTNIIDIEFVYKTPSTLVTHKYDLFHPISDWNTVFLVFYFRLNRIESCSYFYIFPGSFFSRRRYNIYHIFCCIGTNHYIIFKLQ